MTPNENEKLTLKTFSEIAKKKLPNIPIKKLGITKKGHGFIKLPNKAKCDEAYQCLKDSYNVTSENKQQREFLPKITISDIDSSNYSNKNKQELLSAICNKNPQIKSCIDNGKTFEVIFITHDKSKDFSRAVVKLDPDILQVIRQLKYKIYIDFGVCRVSDRFFINQCYRCQKFGHRNDNCQMKTADQHVCRYCSANHASTKCPHKQAGKVENFKCAKCNGNHSSTDTTCPILQKQVDFILKRTKGMEDYPKNSIPPHAIVT